MKNMNKGTINIDNTCNQSAIFYRAKKERCEKLRINYFPFHNIQSIFRIHSFYTTKFFV